MNPRRSPYGWFVEGLLTFATFCSLIVLVAGFLTKVPLWTAVGALVGCAGLVSGFVALGKDLPVPTAITLALGILSIDIAAVAFMWGTT